MGVPISTGQSTSGKNFKPSPRKKLLTSCSGEGNPDVLSFIANLHPMKRMASTHEIAQAALFLLSDRSSFVTGSPMIVDGSMSVRLI